MIERGFPDGDRRTASRHAAGNRLQTRPLPVDASNRQRFERDLRGEGREQTLDRLVDLQVAADFTPDFQDQLHNGSAAVARRLWPRASDNGP